MGKKYSWQKWPDRKKKAESKPTGQTQDPSWKESSIKDLRREEQKSSRDYARMSETAPNQKDAATMRAMSSDEARHARNLRKMEH